jgi:large subunit ribosomal protein L33
MICHGNFKKSIEVELFFCYPYRFCKKARTITMAKKSGRIIVTLECTEARAQGKPVSRYTTTKNKTKTPGRMEKKKYNPNLKKHTLHRETK